MTHRTWLGALVLGTLSGGCATLPDDPVQRALYTDVRYIVDTRERIGWLIDSSEYEGAAPSVLMSVCRSEEEKRIQLLDWLDKRIEEEGGPAEVAYEKNDREMDSHIEELLTLERIRGAIEYAEGRAAEDCPFFISPDPEFDGVQSDTHRFLILGESMGGLMLIFRDGVKLGGGGSLRLLPGYGFTDRLTIVTGIELGGSGLISGVGTDQEQQLEARPTGAIPLIVRLHDDTWLFDFETAALFQYYHGKVTVPPGLRAGFGGGIGSVRIGSFMPYVLGFVAYELMPSFEDLLPTAHGIRIGTRVGVNFDP